MMPKMRRRLARKAAMEKVVVVASWLPPVIVPDVRITPSGSGF